MDWKKVSIILAVLLGLSLLALVGGGVWAFTNGPAAHPLAVATAQATTAAVNGNATGVPPALTPPQGGTPTRAPNPQGAQGGLAGVFGTVASVNGSQVSLANAQGKSRVLNMSDQTRLIVTGVVSPTIASIQSGDKLLVFGVRQGADGLEPRAVVVAPASYTRDNIKAGQIQSISTQSITLLAGNQSVTVNINANTQILSQLLQPIPLNRLTNATAVVIGQPASDGRLTAQLIIARPAP